MPDPITDLTVVNNESGHRYEAWLGEVLAGFSAYELDSQVITFTHTQVADAFEGKGVASNLIRAALDDVRAGANRDVGPLLVRPLLVRPLLVRPLCPFVKAFIQRHEDYQDLLYAGTD